MITFQKISFKNFLSTGNIPTEIILNEVPTTVIIGTNGAGKSTMLDALTFGLFGKPFRDIRKPQLVNSINGKQCLVTVDFDIDGKQYEVIRGIKPNVFEIRCSGELLNQTASSKDYQKILEQQILRLTYKSFTQVVILGSASFVPFMQLSAQDRRDVIEDILDIRIFSVMNILLKNRIQITKNEIDRISNEITKAKDRIHNQKKLIKAINDSRETSIEKLETRVKDLLLLVGIETEKCNTITTEISDMMKSKYFGKNISETYRTLDDATRKLNMEIDALKEYTDFISVNEDCPSCKQKITHEHKNHSIKECRAKKQESENIVTRNKESLIILKEGLDELANLDKVIVEKQIDLSTGINSITILNTQIAEYNKDIQEFKHSIANGDSEKAALKIMANDAMRMVEEKNLLVNQRGLQDIALLLLKDTGIKSAVIREYLPVMNKFINHYLQILDSYIQLELDESFNEVIKSRHRDEFSYHSFSEGEKSRINLALLFVWRKIAKMKNSINTNLLIFDEIFDSSLDILGTENFIQILNAEGDNTNIFIITHKDDTFVDKFSRVLRAKKINDFSVVMKSGS